ncbi:MAG: SH3 domain-containing protein, partial [Chloroflexota bacterium]
ALSVAGIASAQSTLTYGDTVSESISAEAAQRFYSFNGAAGDVVTAYALGWEATFQPTISLLSANGQPLQFSADDPLTALENDTRVTTRLPADGTYSLIVSGEAGGQGTFTLALRSTAPAISTALTDAVTINIPPGAPAQLYSITATANASTPVSVQSGTPGFPFKAQLNDPDGQILAVVTGGLDAATLTIPAGDGTYELLVTAADPTAGGEVTISTTGAAPVTTDTQATALPPTTAPVAGDGCVITASGVNVRSGPGTDYGIVGALTDGVAFTATGQNSGWYVGTFAGQSGWVAASVVQATGDCSSLPVVDAPAFNALSPVTTQEVGDATTEAPPTEEVTEATEAPPTEETEIATEAMATEEMTEPAPMMTEEMMDMETQEVTAQIAPPDDNQAVEYNIKGQPQAYSGSISYPDGDTSDVVNFTLTGYDSVTQRAELSWTVFCNGDAENVEVLFGGQSVGGCNTSFQRAINAGNGNGGGTARASVTIQYTGGDGAYMDWQIQTSTISCAPRDC